jgi:hypothetical protein
MKAVLLRFLRILFAYAVASLVTGFVVQASLLIPDAQTTYVDANYVSFGFLIAFMIAWFASFPAALAITIGEYFRFRMWRYYSVSGSIIGLALGLLFQPPAFFPYLGAGFGIVSGLIYWFLAGRHESLTDAAAHKAIALIMGLVAMICLFLSFLGLFGALR